jgi:hypothetical protein
VVYGVVMRLNYQADVTEAKLSALRAVCLISLDLVDADERLSQLYDRYGEGDDELLEAMMRLAWTLQGMTKHAIMAEYRRLSQIRPLTRNK